MNRNRMLVLAIVALMLSGGVTYLAYRVLQARIQPPQVTTQIVVAAKKLDLGYRITKDDVKLAEWPKSTPLEGSLDKIELAVDRGTITSLLPNEPILESKLAPKGAGAGLMTMIPEGMRALSIQVNSVIGVAGFVLPGSRVDLVLTAVPPKDVRGAKEEEMASKIILENLEVLAAGQNVQRDVDGKPQTVQDVTLLVTPDQAQRVALATGDGRIQLVLRNPMDKNAAEPSLVSRSALYTGPTMETVGSGAKAPPEKPAARIGSAKPKSDTPRKAAPPKREVVAPAPLPTPKIIEVELIQGIKRSKNTFEEANAESTPNSTQPDGTIQ